jgi:hypothetical protein
VWFGLTVVFLVLAVIGAIVMYGIVDDQVAVGVDLVYFQFVAQRWLDTGVYYTPDQLSGPFQVRTLVDNLYPPHALYLFIPFLFLPTILWWVIPLSVIAYVVWWCRPVMWSWPILAFIIMYPKTPSVIIYGNSDMWVTAFIAGGVRWAWPAALVSFKPSILFFSVIGIGSRTWWVAALALALISLPLIHLWLEYPLVVMHSSAKPWYSFGGLLFMVLPVVAWLGSSRRSGRSMWSWMAALFRRRTAPID